MSIFFWGDLKDTFINNNKLKIAVSDNIDENYNIFFHLMVYIKLFFIFS